MGGVVEPDILAYYNQGREQARLDQGYAVTLIDPVELHVEQARAAGVADAVVGDARDLQLADAVADAVCSWGRSTTSPRRRIG
jgi:hypothetical protein